MRVFYAGIASGSQCKTIARLRYPFILVNYMSKNSYYYATRCRKFAKILFIDSGGFPSSFIYNGYNTSDEDYLRFVSQVYADYFALRDYPCEPQILKKFGVTVKDQILRTLDNHLSLLELYENNCVKAKPIPVIQGWKIEDYLHCLDLFQEHGLLKFDYIAIGSTCRRHEVAYTRKIIFAIRDVLPKKIKLHAFGVKISVLDDKAIWDSLYSVDSTAWDFIARWKNLKKKSKTSECMAKDYFYRVRELSRKHEQQTNLLNYTPKCIKLQQTTRLHTLSTPQKHDPPDSTPRRIRKGQRLGRKSEVAQSLSSHL